MTASANGGDGPHPMVDRDDLADDGRFERLQLGGAVIGFAVDHR